MLNLYLKPQTINLLVENRKENFYNSQLDKSS